MGNENNSPTRNSRRAFLKRTGLSATLVGFVGSASATEYVEIVTHVQADQPKFTKEVPKSWYDHHKTAKQAKETIRKKYASRDGFKRFSVTAFDHYFGGKRGFAVNIGITSSDLADQLPSEINGVPVVTEEYGEPIFAACYNDADADDLPGGVVIEDKGTSGTQFYIDIDGDGSYERHLMTALHLYGDSCYDQTGEDIIQKGDTWGTTTLQSSSTDTIVGRSNGGYAVTNEVLEPDTTTRTVAGSVSEDGLADLVSSSTDTVTKVGASLGENVNVVADKDVSDSFSSCVDYQNEGVLLDTNGAPGDSGGPIYDIRNGDAYIVSITSAIDNPTDNYDCNGNRIRKQTIGPSAHNIKDTYKGVFTAPVG